MQQRLPFGRNHFEEGVRVFTFDAHIFCSEIISCIKVHRLNLVASLYVEFSGDVAICELNSFWRQGDSGSAANQVDMGLKFNQFRMVQIILL
jgi:hypothetical protein